MGEVSLAYDSRLKRHVALKTVLLKEGQTDGHTDVVREARAAAGLSHPGIAAIFDIIETPDRTFIVMEYVEGQTLAARLAQGSVPWSEALDLGGQLCDAIDAAHRHGVMHRDLKPANIIIGANGRLKILDFGLAKHVPTAATGSVTTTGGSSVASPGLVGTVGYIAPEQISGKRIDHRCDLFSLGAVLFELFTGQRPFLERDGLAYAVAVTSTTAPLASDLNPFVGAQVSGVIARALARAPADRFASAAEMGQALRAAKQEPIDLPSTTAVATQHHGRLRRSPAAVAALIAVTMVTAALLWFVRAPAGPDNPPGQPSVLAIAPVVTVGGGDVIATAGAGITASILANLSALSGLIVIPVTGAAATGAATAPNVLQRLDAQWVLETVLRNASGGLSLHATLRRSNAAEARWDGDYTGTALGVERQLLDDLTSGLVSAGVVARLSDSERRRVASAPTNDNDAFLAYAKGRTLLAGEPSPDEAARLFQQAIARDPNFALAHAGLSDAHWAAYQRTRDPQRAEQAGEAARRALALDPTQPAVQLSLATMWNRTGRLEEALAAVNRALELQPGSDDGFRLKSRILGQLGQFDAAIAAADGAIALRPNYFANHATRAFVLAQAGRHRDAVPSFRRVTELAPDYADGYQMLGTTLHRLGDVAQAIGNYEHAVRLGPSATAYSNLAYSYYEAGRYDESLKAYQESVARDSARPAVHRNIGDVHARLGHAAEATAAYRDAITTANKLLTVNRGDAATIALVALCEAKLGLAAAAERHAAEALALRPADRDVVVRNAEVYAILRQSRRALDYLRQAVGLGYEPGRARSNEELASLKSLSDFEAALSIATR
jgi:tetratricopeptide (TPR) repeat protein/TolB-like protein